MALALAALYTASLVYFVDLVRDIWRRTNN